jgi:hypothetical protein
MGGMSCCAIRIRTLLCASVTLLGNRDIVVADEVEKVVHSSCCGGLGGMLFFCSATMEPRVRSMKSINGVCSLVEDAINFDLIGEDFDCDDLGIMDSGLEYNGFGALVLKTDSCGYGVFELISDDDDDCKALLFDSGEPESKLCDIAHQEYLSRDATSPEARLSEALETISLRLEPASKESWADFLLLELILVIEITDI